MVTSARLVCFYLLGFSLLWGARSGDLERLAEVERGGNGAEKVAMARRLLDGDGFDRDVPRAVKLLHASASAGDEAAMEMLGLVMTNYKESEQAGYEWLLEAGKKGRTRARERLMLAYSQGWLKGFNSAQLNWVRYWDYQGGNLQAGYELSKSLLRNEWAPVTELTAPKLLLELVEKRHPDAIAEYAYQSIAAGATTLREWRPSFEIAAEGGSVLGKWLLYRYYLEFGTPAEKEKGRLMLREASKAGFPRAIVDQGLWLVASGDELDVRLGLADLRQMSAKMVPDADFYLYDFFASRNRGSYDLAQAFKFARAGWSNVRDVRCGKALAYGIADGLVSPSFRGELEYLCRAMAPGDADMAKLLQSSLVDGKVRVRSWEEVKSVLEAKSASGDSSAMARLGALHESGSFGVADMDQALGWYLKGAQSGSSECLQKAMDLLADARRHTELLALIRSHREAPFAATIKNRLDAMLLRALRESSEPPVGPGESLIYYSELAAKGDVSASLKLSKVYLEMSPPRYAEAVACLRFSLSQESTAQEARDRLYALWRENHYEPADAGERASFLEANIKNGDRSPVTLNNLAVALHDAGQPERAIGLYKDAICAGNSMAIYNLAICYESGVGIPRDRTFAYILQRSFLVHAPPDRADLIRKTQESIADYELKYQGSYVRILAMAEAFQALFKDRRLSPELISTTGLASLGGRPQPAPPGPPDSSRSGSGVSTGSGMVFTREGHVFTNLHVVAGRAVIRVKSAGSLYQARLLAADRVNDVAILALEGWNNPLRASPPRIAILRPPDAAGRDVFLWGFPLYGELSREPNFQKGAINAFQGGPGRSNMMQVSTPMQSGNSGGPVCLEDGGGVVGLAVAKLMYAQGEIYQNLNFAVRSEYLLRLAKENGVPIDSDGPADRDSVRRHTVLVLAE